MDFHSLIDASNNPAFTFSTFYRKSSIFESLANVELEYSQLNTGRSYGDEPEYTYYIRGYRPLVSPYSKMAGGFEFSKNWSQNINQVPNSTILKYEYNIADARLAYNFGAPKKDFANRDRIFLEGRYLNGYFPEQPDQIEYAREINYNNVNAYLTELTFYRQNYYRTHYEFGFERTEDVPYGKSLSITSGYPHQVGIERPYLRAKYQY